MAPPDLPAPDDVFQDLLAGIFGPDSWVVYLAVVIAFLLAWYGFASSAGRRVAAAYRTAAAVPRVRRGAAVALTLLAAAGQVFYLLVSYCIATFVPHVVDNLDESAAAAPVDVVSWTSGLPDAPTDRGAFWVWLVISLAVAATGWSHAAGTFDGVGPLDPVVWLLLACGAVAFPVFYLLASEVELDAAKGEVPGEQVVRMHAFAWLSLIYTVLAAVAVHAPGRCAKAWRGEPARA